MKVGLSKFVRSAVLGFRYIPKNKLRSVGRVFETFKSSKQKDETVLLSVSYYRRLQRFYAFERHHYS